MKVQGPDCSLASQSPNTDTGSDDMYAQKLYVHIYIYNLDKINIINPCLYIYIYILTAGCSQYI